MSNGKMILLPSSFIKLALALFTVKILTNVEVVGDCVAGTCLRREGAEYFVSRSEHVWNDAHDICSVMGGNLLDTYSSNADKDFLKQNVTFKKNQKFWIGLLKNDSKPVRQVRQTDTDLLRIDNGCLKVQWSRTTSSLQFINTPCSWTAMSICVKVTDNRSNCEGGTENLSGQTNCFLEVHQRMTWFGAHAHCEALNASILTKEVLLMNMTNSSHKILSRQYWIDRRPRLLINPKARWKNTSDDGVFEYPDDIQIRITSVGCRGCGFWKDSKVFLGDECEKSHLAICKFKLPRYANSSNMVSQRSSTWFDANNTCHSLGGLPLPDDLQLDEFKNIFTNFTIWLGLYKNASDGKPNCTNIEKEDESKFVDFTLDKCYSVGCSNLTEEKVQTPCSSWNNPLCVRAKSTSQDNNCASPWKDCQELCCLFFYNVRTNWIAAHVFCLEQGGHLANSTELVSNKISLNNTGKHSSCWIATREVFAPLNPLDGWHWINGSPFDYRTSWSFGTLKNTGQVGPRCAALSSRSSWEVLNCSKPYFFICKMNKTEENYQNYQYFCEGNTSKPTVVTPSNTVDVSSENYSEGNTSTPTVETGGDMVEGSSDVRAEFNKTLEMLENVTQLDGSTEGYNSEEVLSSIENAALGIINGASFNATITKTTDKIELHVFATTLDDLVNGARNISYPIPLETIRKLCETASCEVKGAILRVKSVRLNIKSLRESPLSTSADVLSLNYLVERKLVKKLQEKLSLKFRRKAQTNQSEFHCVYLDGMEWSEKGLETGSFTEETVECITNHLTSFAVVVLDAEMDDENTKVMKYISYIGTALSLTALIVTLFTYIYLYKDLQVLSNSQQLVHLNLLIALGGTQIVFLAGGNQSREEIFCKIVAVLLHYFSLASLCWMLLEAVMLYLKLISVFGGENVRMRKFCAFGWGFPCVFVIVTAGASIDSYGSNNWCWLSYERGYFWVFFAPVIAILTFNFITIIAVVCVVCRAARKYEDNERHHIYAAIRGVAILFPTLGLSWIFMVISAYHDAVVWNYLFVIFNSMQGFLIFVIYGVCNEEIRAAFKRRLGREVKPFTSTSHN